MTTEPVDLKTTIKLPQTEFPMRGNMAQREPELLQRWEAEQLQTQIEKAGEKRPLFVLHDGPPYANGHIHTGHILNKVLKDIVVKYRTMTGHRAVYVPGWDCHGLPIELQVDRDLGPKKAELSVQEIRRACREYALRFVDIQREEFKRLGVFGRWDRPYLTLSPHYEASIVRELSRLAEGGFLYKGKKPVHWCASCRTALAEAEVEYKDRTSPSVFVAFDYEGDPERLLPSLAGRKVAFLIWTTTPWTLPANLAIALHPDLAYVAVEAGDRVLVVARELAESVRALCGLTAWNVLGEIDTRAAVGTTCRHPFIDRKSLLLFADYVTLDAGSGCVHTAPGHGQEDYQTGVAHGLEIYAPVDEGGRFTADVAGFAGQQVFDANKGIVALLHRLGALLNPPEASIQHSYPHCWRCKHPVIFRATPQWFVQLEHAGLRQRALAAVDATTWVPPWGHDRIYGMIEHRPDWCLSRQRLWGVPIPALTCEDCGEVLASAAFMQHVAELFARHGADHWFTSDPEALLPPSLACSKCQGRRFRKEEDIVDVWFESGVSWAAVCEPHEELWPIDLYLEGSDQHRGWFHSSLLTAVANRGKAPYRTVLTHGFVVNEHGQPYSKSLKNYIPPETVIRSRGAELLRLWTAYVDYRNDMPFSETILTQLGESYRKIRNTARFLLGNLADFPVERWKDVEGFSQLDRWAMSSLSRLIRRCREAYETYEFHVVYRQLIEFCATDLSAFYLDVVKDRLYCEGPAARSPTQAVLYSIARALATLMAPVLPFTAEDIWAHLPRLPDDPTSVHLAQIPAPGDEDAALLEYVDALGPIRTVVLKELEAFRAQKHHSLDALVRLRLTEQDRRLIDRYAESLADLFIVSEVVVETQGSATGAVVEEASGVKCPRCWKRSPGIGTGPHPDLCPRCAGVISATGWSV
ncbi:MAG: isoleucine--tRNA ligase [Deltaproteobacteria bacterium]|nr:isoleucine--tRNA ligase [Deltaproteobacteria bacterium]